jgi:hypothetical protein
MADQNIVKKISIDGQLYDIDGEYLRGLSPSIKQDTLVSGDNIKTINGESIVGGGNIVIKEGENYAGNYPINVTEKGVSNIIIEPNMLNIINNTSSVTINFATPSNANIINEYIFVWYCSSGQLYLPSSIVWEDNEVLSPTSGNTYIVSIKDNVAIYGEFIGNVYEIGVIKFTIEQSISTFKEYTADVGMTWRQWVNSNYDHTFVESDIPYIIEYNSYLGYDIVIPFGHSSVYKVYIGNNCVNADDVIMPYTIYTYKGEK